MKIAIVCLNLQWQAGGTRLIYSLAHGLMSQGHRVIIYAPITNEDAYPELRRGLDIVVVSGAYFPERTVLPSSLAAQIWNRVRQERNRVLAAKRIAAVMDDDFDAVNLHDFAYKIGYFYKKKNSAAAIIWTENDPPFSYVPKGRGVRDTLSRIYNWFKDFTEKKYFSAIGRVAVLDGYNERWCRTRGLDPVVIRSGVDFENFNTSVHFRGGNSLHIIAVGALNRYRRFEDIIGAVASLRDAGRSDSLLVVCKDIWSDAAYRKQLEGLVRDLKLESAITLKFDGLSGDELKKAYAESDVYVLSTYIPPPRAGYGWGLSNFEAMAAGIPIVICRTCTATEVLHDGKDALFVDPESPEDIARKIMALAADPAMARDIAAGGQDFVRHNLSWDRYARGMVDLFLK